MIETIYQWHGRIGHVNFTYINNIQSVDLISDLDSNTIEVENIYL